MSRYIDQDVLLSKLPDDLPYKASVKRVLIQAPTADVVKVRHGEWISVQDDIIFECSICGTVVSTSWDYDDTEMFSFCPCCGADMKGGA